MNKVNRVLLLFLVVVTAIFWVVWKGVQTEQFGEYLSKKIKKISYEKTGLDITFERIDISLIPLATTMRSFKVEDKDLNLSLKANYLRFSFGLTDLVSPSMSIGNILLDDAELTIIQTGQPKKQNKEDFKVSDIFKIYQEFYNEKLNFKIRSLSVENTDIFLPEANFVIRRMSTSLYPTLVTSSALLESIYLTSRDDLIMDQLDYDFQLSEEGFRIKKVKALDGINSLDIVGKFGFVKKNPLNIIFNYKGNLDLRAIEDIVQNNKELKEIEADLDIEGRVVGLVENPKINLKSNIKGFTSDYAKIDEVEIDVMYESNIISVGKIQAKVNSGSLLASVDKPVFNIKEKELLINSLDAEIVNLHSNDFLYYIREDLKPLKLRATGNVSIFKEGKDIRFEPWAGFVAKKSRLLNKRETQVIIEPNGEITWLSGKGITVFDKGGVGFDAQLNLVESKVSVQGTIDDEINLKLLSKKINLENVGPISGTGLSGIGELEMDIVGPADNVIFDKKFKIDDFSFLDINLGQVKGNGSLELENLILSVNIEEGRYLSSLYNAGGKIFFEGDENLKLNGNVLYGSFSDIEKMVPAVFENISEYSKYFNSTVKGQLELYGGFEDKLLGVRGKMNGGGKYKKELIDKYSVDFNYLGKILTLDRVSILKSRGSVNGNLKYDFNKNLNEYNFKVDNIFLRDLQNVNEIGLGYNGLVSGAIKGSGSVESPIVKIDLKISNGQIGEYQVRDSIISLHREAQKYFIRSNIFQGELTLNSVLDLAEKNSGKSKIEIKVDTKDLRKIFGILSLHNLDDPGMGGFAKFNIDMGFDANNILELDATANMERFRWYKKDQQIDIARPVQIIVEKGIIKKWNLATENLSRNRIKFVGDGNFLSKVRLDADFNISSVFADIFTEKLNFRKGRLNGRMRIIGEKGRFSTYLDFNGEDVVLKTLGLRTPLNKMNFTIILDGDKLNLNSLQAELGGGNILASGNGRLKFPFPELNLYLEAKNIRQPLYNKSFFVFDSNLTLEGKDIPYDVSGTAIVKAAEVRDEFKDMKDDSFINQGYRKYIPRSAVGETRSPLRLNIAARFSQPISIKNSLLDVNLDGNVDVVNTLKNTLYRGNLSLVQNKNFLFLKGHEFAFEEEGALELVPLQEEQQIKLDFLSMAKINEYDVFTAIKGTVSELEVDMYSRPDLTQGDLLSLITLGVTSDVSQNLGEKERQSVTTLGLGGIVLDQLGINQNLNKSFGLKLSVAPEIEEDDGSLLRGRTEDAGSETGMKTGTRIQVKKELADKVDLSLSSTVGGASRQKQEMNVDVKINEVFSIEGVYEMRSTDELEEENPDSIGADLKWRFSF